tara:strand:- start:5296 stop:5490 length:195 start_codon:yes stop_codon:yes gene_type:complete
MFVANFLGGPDRGSRYKEPINVQVSFIDYLVFKVFGATAFMNRYADYSGDYFSGVYFYGRKYKI